MQADTCRVSLETMSIRASLLTALLLTTLPTLAQTAANALSKQEAAQGWHIEELHTEEGRLDEVFRSITKPDTIKEEGVKPVASVT